MGKIELGNVFVDGRSVTLESSNLEKVQELIIKNDEKRNEKINLINKILVGLQEEV